MLVEKKADYLAAWKGYSLVAELVAQLAEPKGWWMVDSKVDSKVD